MMNQEIISTIKGTFYLLCVIACCVIGQYYLPFLFIVCMIAFTAAVHLEIQAYYHYKRMRKSLAVSKYPVSKHPVSKYPVGSHVVITGNNGGNIKHFVNVGDVCLIVGHFGKDSVTVSWSNGRIQTVHVSNIEHWNN